MQYQLLTILKNQTFGLTCMRFSQEAAESDMDDQLRVEDLTGFMIVSSDGNIRWYDTEGVLVTTHSFLRSKSCPSSSTSR